MPNRTPILVHLRRIPVLIDNGISNGPDGLIDPNEHPEFVHAACSMFLLSTLAYLVSEDGEYSWDTPGANYPDFDIFTQAEPSGKQPYSQRGITKANLTALAKIRNAVAHNDCDLSRNTDKNSLNIVSGSNIPGVTLKGSVVELSRDFVEFTRQAGVAVRQYHGVTIP